MLDILAIHKAYPDVVHTNGDSKKVFDKDWKEVTIEQSKVDAARTELNTEAAAVKYKTDRADAYPSIGDQLDMQYWDKKNGTTTWVDAIAKVKADNPKP
tara:strand:- start:103 stop:399 length:297 start_codon:yes stop_codon:yes gene_type:complete